MINRYTFLLLFSFFSSCHIGYKSLSKVNPKYDISLQYYELEEPIKSLFKGHYEAIYNFIGYRDVFDSIERKIVSERIYRNPKDTSKYKKLELVISYDSNYPIDFIEAYNLNSPKMKLKAFGLYFKIGGKRFFDDSPNIESPIIYYNSFFYFPINKFSSFDDDTLKPKDYRRRYFIKKKVTLKKNSAKKKNK